MRSIIKKILRESDDFDWARQSYNIYPLKPGIRYVLNFCDNSFKKNEKAIKNKIEELHSYTTNYKNRPGVDWFTNSFIEDEDYIFKGFIQIIGDIDRNKISGGWYKCSKFNGPVLGDQDLTIEQFLNSYIEY